MITLNAGTLARVLGVLIVLLLLASTAAHAVAAARGMEVTHWFVQLFDVDSETNLPTWYSSILLLVSAVLLAAIGNAERNRTAWARYWLALSLIFVALSADEVAGFHSALTGPARKLVALEGVLFLLAWVVPAAALLLVAAVVFARWFFHLPARTRTMAGLSAVIYVSGAIGMELWSGLLYAQGFPHGTAPYIAVSTLEEAMEMGGLLLWNYALLDYAGSRGYGLALRFTTVTGAKREAAGRGA